MKLKSSLSSPLDMEREDEEEELVLSLSRKEVVLSEELLPVLISISRSSSGRAHLASLGLLGDLLSLLEVSPSSNLLRLLRNLCAGESSCQDAFLSAHGVFSVYSLVQALLSRGGFKPEQHSDSDDSSLLLGIALQVLANLCGGGDRHKDAVWEAFFPSSTFLEIACRVDAFSTSLAPGKVMGPLCMIIYVCSRENEARLKSLCQDEGASLVAACLIASRNCIDDAGDWVILLVSQICIQHPFLPCLFKNVGLISSLASPISNISDPKSVFNLGQALLMEHLYFSLNEDRMLPSSTKKEKEDGSLNKEENASSCYILVSIEILLFLVEVVRDALQYCLNDEEPISYGKLPTGKLYVDVLGYTLGIMRVITSTPNEDDDNSNNYNSSSVFVSCGLIEISIHLLRGLGPPELVSRAIIQQQNTNAEKDEQIDDAKSLNASGSSAEVVSRTIYEGCRRDVVGIIGNAAFRNKQVQEEVRRFGGLYLVLQQCVIDKDNPFLREWGLWAIRNLLEGNEENCKEVEEMKLKGACTPEEVTHMGFKVEINPQTGRPHLVNTPR